jgi:hypothetical protein
MASKSVKPFRDCFSAIDGDDFGVGNESEGVDNDVIEGFEVGKCFGLVGWAPE